MSALPSSQTAARGGCAGHDREVVLKALEVGAN